MSVLSYVFLNMFFEFYSVLLKFVVIFFYVSIILGKCLINVILRWEIIIL